MNRELLTVRDACREYGYPRDYLYELIHAGTLPVIGSGRRFLIPRRAIEAMLDSLANEVRKQGPLTSDAA